MHLLVAKGQRTHPPERLPCCLLALRLGLLHCVAADIQGPRRKSLCTRVCLPGVASCFLGCAVFLKAEGRGAAGGHLTPPSGAPSHCCETVDTHTREVATDFYPCG